VYAEREEDVRAVTKLGLRNSAVVTEGKRRNRKKKLPYSKEEKKPTNWQMKAMGVNEIRDF